jgi:hypothetical protein
VICPEPIAWDEGSKPGVSGPIATTSIRLMPPLVGIRSQVLDERIIA